jgi:2-hydroxy-3-keto-5-methylthiopentenyl-1-phosphate phosphatase
VTRALLITDFDGTLTERDFYQLAVERLVPADLPDHWADYRAGKTTHFDALAAIFASIRATDEQALLAVAHDMGLQPDLATQVGRLRAADWDVAVVSAGCGWYIDRLLAGAGVELVVHANPGGFVLGGGLRMRRPDDPRFRSHELGVDKAAVVRDALRKVPTVAFAGDGYPDLEAARLVAPARRYARGDLAAAAAEEGLTYRSFDRWSDVVDGLLADGRSDGEPEGRSDGEPEVEADGQTEGEADGLTDGQTEAGHRG